MPWIGWLRVGKFEPGIHQCTFHTPRAGTSSGVCEKAPVTRVSRKVARPRNRRGIEGGCRESVSDIDEGIFLWFRHRIDFAAKPMDFLQSQNFEKFFVRENKGENGNFSALLERLP